MNGRMGFSTRACLGLLAGLTTFGAAACEVVASFPANLGNGAYCLASDLAVGGATPFQIGHDTTLDCRGHKIRDTSQTAFAVIASGDNIALRNCVFEGFSEPVFFNGVTNYAIEGNTFINAQSRAMSVEGSQGSVRANTVINTIARSDQFTAMNITGIADVIGNTVIDSKSSPAEEPYARYGILSYDNDGGVIASNIVQNIPGGHGWAMLAGGRSIVYRNVVVAAPGIGDVGLNCDRWSGLYLQNVIAGHPVPYFQCSSPN